VSCLPKLVVTLFATTKLLFKQILLLRIDGLKLVQSNAIIRYIARKNNLLGVSDVDMARSVNHSIFFH